MRIMNRFFITKISVVLLSMGLLATGCGSDVGDGDTIKEDFSYITCDSGYAFLRLGDSVARNYGSGMARFPEMDHKC